MQSDKAAPDNKEGFNQFTVDWQAADFDISLADPKPYDADPADVAAYQRDGVVCLRGVFTDWVEPLRAGLERNLAAPEAYAFPAESTKPGAPGRYFDSYCNWQLIPEYRDYVLQSCTASLAGQIMRTSRAQFFHEHVFLKEPGTQTATPWHQDLPYYCVDGDESASIFMALDPIDEAVALRFVKGSHRWPFLTYPRVFMDSSDFNTDDPGLRPMPAIDDEPEEYEIITWGLEPGDVVVFNFKTAHGTSDAEVKTRRRAFSGRWMGGDITYCEREGETSPPYRDHGMVTGDALREDWFPVLWRQNSG